MARRGEIGRLGQKRFHNGIFYEEFVPELVGLRGIEAFKEMANNDSIVGGILFAIEMLIRQCDFSISPGGDTEADKKAAQFVEECMYDMEYTWTDTLSEILSFLTYGWSYHEIVYKIRGGRKKDVGLSSKYDDGLIGWKKIPIRSQDTFYEWSYEGDTDKLLGMIQCAPPNYAQVLIPIEKALHFTTKSIKANPEGKSILRTAYRDWYFKKRIQEIEGIGIERDLAGFPTITAPEGVDLWDREDPDMVQALANATEIVTGIRRDTREGLVLPFGWTLSLLSTGSRRQFDTNQIIDRYNKSIATSVLADFILMGQQAVGSFALADNKTSLFALAVGTYLDIICEVFNNQAIRRLIDLNESHFQGITDYPEMTHGDIEDEDLQAFSKFVTDMVGAGIITPDEELEKHVRNVGRLPEKVETAGDNPAKQDEYKPKEDSATMYKIQSALQKYTSGQFPRDLTYKMLLKIGISEEEAESYLSDCDKQRAENKKEQKEKKDNSTDTKQQEEDAKDAEEAAVAKSWLEKLISG